MVPMDTATIPTVMDVKNLVTKSNLLIEANYRLGLVEQKIILCVASNIQPNDSDFKTYTFPIKEFHKLIGLKGSPKYTELRKITKELMRKVFEVRVNNKVVQVAWLSYVSYNEQEGTIDVRFDPFLRPFLLELKKNFTSYRLENVVKLKSSYAIRLYELLKQYEKIRERMFTLDDLRNILGADDIYPAYGNFKQRILVPAQNELKDKTDIQFDIAEYKTGRKVDRVKFIIRGRTYGEKPTRVFEERLSEFQAANTFSERAKRLAIQQGFVLQEQTLKQWSKYGEDTVLQVLEEFRFQTGIENPIGYITRILQNKVAKDVSSQSLPNTSTQNQGVYQTLKHIQAEYARSSELLPDWFIRDAVVRKLIQYLPEEEAITIWEQEQERFMQELHVQIQHNKSKRAQSKW